MERFTRTLFIQSLFKINVSNKIKTELHSTLIQKDIANLLGSSDDNFADIIGSYRAPIERLLSLEKLLSKYYVASNKTIFFNTNGC